MKSIAYLIVVTYKYNAMLRDQGVTIIEHHFSSVTFDHYNS